jgi:pimeloyl-ACP methyl ester carboxylesterase
MPSIASPATAVALPGTGSSAAFAQRAFEPALADAGLRLVAVDPGPEGIVPSYLRALDEAAAADGPLLIAGISIGAAVGLRWAAEHPEHTHGVLAVLPPWIGLPGDAPAAVSAADTARRLRAHGLDSVIEFMRAGSPAWLADILTPSWRAQWPFLPDALEEAARYVAPTDAELAACPVPVAVVGATDDPVHPFPIAQRWADLLPRGELGRVTLEQIGVDPGVIGQVALATLGRVACLDALVHVIEPRPAPTGLHGKPDDL